MVELNWDILTRIALYVPESPIIYTNLASVNRLFYQIFTSDMLWKRLNPYGVEKDIFREFITQTSTVEDKAFVKGMWIRGVSEQWDIEDLLGQCINNYAALGYLCDKGWSIIKEPTWFAYLLAEYRPLMITWLSIYPKAIMRGTKGLPTWAYLAASSKNAEVLADVDPSMLVNYDFAASAVKENGLTLEYFPHFKDNHQIASAAVGNTLGAVPFISHRLQTEFFIDQRVLMATVHVYPHVLESHPRLSDNVTVIKAAINGDPYQFDTFFVGLKYASDRLKDDEELVEYAIKKVGNNILFASERLQTKERVLRALERFCFQRWAAQRYPGDPHDVMACLPKALKKDKSVVKALVGYNGRLLASFPDFADDFDVAMAAATAVFPAPEYISPRLMFNRDIMRAHYKKTIGSMLYFQLPRELQVDKEILKYAKVPPDASYIPKEIAADKNIILGFIANYDNIYDANLRVPNQFWDDFDVVKAAVSKSAWALESASPRLRNDREILRAAFSNSWAPTGNVPCPMEYIGPEALEDFEFIQSLVANWGTKSTQVLDRYPELFKLAVTKDPEAAEYLELLDDDEVEGFIETALRSNPKTFGYIDSLSLRRGWKEQLLNLRG